MNHTEDWIFVSHGNVFSSTVCYSSIKWCYNITASRYFHVSHNYAHYEIQQVYYLGKNHMLVATKRRNWFSR